MWDDICMSGTQKKRKKQRKKEGRKEETETWRRRQKEYVIETRKSVSLSFGKETEEETRREKISGEKVSILS